MKTSISPELLAHYRSGATTLAMLWKIMRADGQVFGFSTHDRPINYEGVLYKPSTAFDASAVSSRSELNVDNLEASGLLEDDGITVEDLEAGLWNGAGVELIRVNYMDLTMGHEDIRVGTIGQVNRSGLTYSAEFRGLLHMLQNNIGRRLLPACDARLGDARCGVDVESFRATGTVATSSTARDFTSNDLSAEAGYTYGVVRWETGANAGRSMEVKTYTTGGTFSLQLPMAHPVLPGDEFSVIPGCDKGKTTCRETFDNVVNFRGFDLIPGQDAIMLVGGQ